MPLVKFEAIAANLVFGFSSFSGSQGVPELMSESSFCFEPDKEI